MASDLALGGGRPDEGTDFAAQEQARESAAKERYLRGSLDLTKALPLPSRKVGCRSATLCAS